MYKDFGVSEKMLSAFNISLEQYLSLDKDTKFLLDRAYWEFEANPNVKKENNIKTKVLSIFKKKQ
ncbi:MAG: hypothetical protein IJ068_00605 [Bacilli bacterium]|nr:hypothetical protein [Bacilli bacterium]